ncbi:hypothetical protein PN36_29850 [Candidatus Thiomargarita nelsonii]|uniref:Uncharacterized protein n=1 Tax=Candidatus Thiomargarita nelsonii TaxID=1003181 RepID=A0A0A6S5Z9_9GAMM|nr:hypothetical protein PN36_29850 [Candidatus Thiomargarita nelsonii]
MSYSEFSLKRVKKEFNLTEKKVKLFDSENEIEASDWLKETLDLSLELALSSSSEKARSEFIVAPILLELEKINNKSFSIFSGENLEADSEKGLNGECDFILSKGPISSTIQVPIFSLVEAKKNDVKEGLGQCIAQMQGAKIFTQNEGADFNFIYGCVTTGETWQFMRLENDILSMDIRRYYINEVGKLLWVFQYIIDSFNS